MKNPAAALDALADVDGVVGGFLVDEGGRLVVRHMDRLFDDDVLEQTGPLLSRLAEALDVGSGSAEWLLITYRDHKLAVRKVAACFLCVVAEMRANVAALRMAANLLSRRLEPLAKTPAKAEPPQVDDLPSTVPPPAASRRRAVAPPEASTRRPGAAQPKAGFETAGSTRYRIFRGRRYEVK